jgi:hypothetical protein
MIAIVININRKSIKLMQFVTVHFFKIYLSISSDLEPEPLLVTASALPNDPAPQHCGYDGKLF